MLHLKNIDNKVIPMNNLLISYYLLVQHAQYEKAHRNHASWVLKLITLVPSDKWLIFWMFVQDYLFTTACQEHECMCNILVTIANLIFTSFVFPDKNTDTKTPLSEGFHFGFTISFYCSSLWKTM